MLEKEEPIQQKIAIEKMIFQTNDKISQFVFKIISSKTVVTYPQNEEEIMERTRDFVRYILLDDKIEKHASWVQSDLLFNIIKRYKCDVDYANSIFSNMGDLGLDFCGDTKTVTNMYGLPDTMTEYDILQFAEMRGFLSENEIRQVKKKPKTT